MEPQPKEKIIPIWLFTFPSRTRDDENGYRSHFLDADHRQIRAMIVLVMLFMLTLNVADLLFNSSQESLAQGIIFRVILIVIGVILLLWLKSNTTARALDLAALTFSLSVAIGVVIYHNNPEVTPVRILGIVLTFIFVSHIAFPNYAILMGFPIILLLAGETYNVAFSGREDLQSHQLTMLLIALFAECVGIFSSAYHHQARYQAYKAMKHVKLLSGLLPICSSCKKIRDDQGYYQKIETYITEHSEAQFTHGICPDCASDMYAEIAEYKKSD